MANLPTGFDNIDLTKGGFYTEINDLISYLSGAIGENGTGDGVKLHLELDSVDNTSDAAKPISTAVANALLGKQDTLVSGTSIKTINSTSILGSGNLTLQSTLVSGTSIKTINGTSLLGSGNITTPTVTLSDSVSSTSTTVAASSLAIKTAYDLADSKQDNLKYTADSATYIIASGTGKEIPETSMSKVFQAQMPFGGTVKVYFSLTTTNSGSDAYGQIYVNGIAVGTLRGRTTSGTSAFNENITINKHDYVQVYARKDGYYNTYTSSVGSISIRSDIAFEPSVINY